MGPTNVPPVSVSLQNGQNCQLVWWASCVVHGCMWQPLLKLNWVFQTARSVEQARGARLSGLRLLVPAPRTMGSSHLLGRCSLATRCCWVLHNILSKLVQLGPSGLDVLANRRERVRGHLHEGSVLLGLAV